MAKNKWVQDLQTMLASEESATGGRSGGNQLTRWGNTSPTSTSPTMTADEVRDTVTGRDDVASGFGVSGGPLQVGGATPNNGFGTGAWRGLVMPGGKNVSDYNALMAMAPGAYQSQYQTAMNGIMNNLLGAKPFSYDVNADGLYQQIKDNYMKAGRQAMMDTTGQSAALTGGYGNSYGVTAGNQAYQESLGNLAAAIPELQQLAYSQYEQGLTDQRANLEALNRLDEQAYARWADDAQAYQELLDKLPETMRTGGVDPFAGMYGGKEVITPYNQPGAGTPSKNIDMAAYMAMMDLVNKGYATPQQLAAWNAAGYNIGVDSTTMGAFLDANMPPDVMTGAAPKPTSTGGTGGTGGTGTSTAEQVADYLAGKQKPKN